MNPHHRHGTVWAGRVFVGVATLLALGADVMLFRVMPQVQVTVAVSMIWLVAGAVGLWLRKAWGRYLVLTILYVGTLASFVIAIVTLATSDETLPLLKPLSIYIVIYFILSLVLTHSKNVQRLTSRAYE